VTSKSKFADVQAQTRQKGSQVILRGQKVNPLQVLWTLGPVSRHEVHGSLEGPLEALWDAIEKHRALLKTLFTATQVMESQESIWSALDRVNDRAESAIKDQLRVSFDAQ
jgi:hypothetical protein